MSSEIVTAFSVVAVALIGVFGSIMVALLSSTRNHAKVIRDQTENEHVSNPKKISNLRDNIDYNQMLLMGKFDTMIDTQRTHSNMIANLFQVQRAHSTQIDEITKDTPIVSST